MFSAKKCAELENWHKETLDNYILYVHKDCEVSKVENLNNISILIGYIIDPKFPQKKSSDILTDISTLSEINQITEFLYGLVGRYVLLIKKQNRLFFLNDPFGLKTIYYTRYEDEIYAASQPLLIKLVIPIKKGSKYQQYYDSAYVEKVKEHYLPAGTSLYNEVYHLTPNHYFDSLSFRQIRYFPNKPIKKKEQEEALQEFTSLLKKTMIAANNRFRLALAITGGLDSRMILGACKEIVGDIYFYTLQFRNLTKNSNDIIIPKKLLSHLGLQHNIINCRKPVNKDFEEIYINNTDIHHFNDWGLMASGEHDEFPPGHIAVKGNGVEIGRCIFYRNYQLRKHPEISSCEQIFSFNDVAYGWENIPFIRKRVSDWFDEIKNNKDNFGYGLLDLFYWEHRIGSWLAQNQLERDIVHDVFLPFNNRELIDVMLSVNPEYRFLPDFLFYKKSIQILWKELLIQPINPLQQKNNVKNIIKNKMKRLLIGTGVINNTTLNRLKSSWIGKFFQ